MLISFSLSRFEPLITLIVKLSSKVLPSREYIRAIFSWASKFLEIVNKSLLIISISDTSWLNLISNPAAEAELKVKYKSLPLISDVISTKLSVDT